MLKVRVVVIIPLSPTRLFGGREAGAGDNVAAILQVQPHALSDHSSVVLIDILVSRQTLRCHAEKIGLHTRHLCMYVCV